MAEIVHRGLLGWSNKRPGLEFYRYDNKIIPRHKSEWGELLVDDMSRDLEGCPVLVVVMGREATEDEVNEMRDGIASQILDYN